MKKNIIFLLLIIGSAPSLKGQVIRKESFKFVNTKDYLVLKADFHLHTIFSDGNVWPYVRPEEAFAEDIDIIAITDHLEYRPNQAELTNSDHNYSYKLAYPTAEALDVILIPST